MSTTSLGAPGPWGISAREPSQSGLGPGQDTPAGAAAGMQESEQVDLRNGPLSRGVGEDRINAYLATALTGLSPQERAHVFEMSDVTADVCDEAGISLYQPRAKTDPVHNPAVPDHEVFRRDRRRVRRSDLLIYLADYPSTGAGLELVFAYEALIPIVVLANQSTRVSRMVTGSPGSLFLVRYRSIEEFREALLERFREILPSLMQKRATLRRHNRNRLGERIRVLREARGMSHEDLAREIGAEFFNASQIREWEESSDVESNLNTMYLREIAAALNAKAADLLI